MPSEAEKGRIPVGRNAVAQVVGDLGGRASGAVLQIAIARSLGSGAFGEFSYALAVAVVIGIFSDLGLGTLVTREVARRPEDTRTILSRALWTRATLALLLGAAAVALHRIWGQPAGTIRLLAVLAAAQIAQGQGEILAAALRGRERMVWPARLSLWCRFGLLATAVAALSGGAGSGALAGLFAGWAIVFPLLLRLFVLPGRPSGPPRPREALAFLRRSAPIGLGVALWALSFRLDLLATGWLRGEDAVGLFAAPFRLVEAILLTSGPLLGAVFPLLARQSGDRALRKASRLLLAFGIPTAAVLMVEGPGIVTAIFGPEYASASVAVIPLAAAIPVSFLAAPVLTLLIARDRERSYAAVMGLSLLIHAAAAFTLIPSHGILGAAFSFFAAEAAVLLLAVLFARNVRGGVPGTTRAGSS